jgi:hypothetical protein
MKRFLILALLFTSALYGQQPASHGTLQFIFSSDAHYGITRAMFRGRHDVDAHIVNAAMIAVMNRISEARLPVDGGVDAGQPVGPIDFVVETGDIANREETTGGPHGGPIQSAARSWAQFKADYIDGITLRDSADRHSEIFVTPGNHDATNAVGFYKPMSPRVDPTAMIDIYNMMMKPAVPRTATTYHYDADRVLTSRDIGGIHLVFLDVWPDLRGRAWMETDMKSVSPSTPVFLFTHDQPDVEARQFMNPNGRHDINAVDKFENLLSEQLAGATTIDSLSTANQRQLEVFLKHHTNIRAYFHGNSNWTEFYDWKGPDRSITLPVFRVDSPMKGKVSAKDETKLAFELITIDRASKRLTARECLWNTNPKNPAAPLAWGAGRTVSLGS